VAVGSVLIYHLFPGRLPGGYIGVDVFFAISGFLIGSQLTDELAATGRIRLGRFWARRAKRLLPASSLVLGLTAVGVFAWVPLNVWRQFFTEIGASVLYIQNWQLAHDSVDYLAAANAPSPVQHFWTLSVEEQFYVAVPLALIAGLGLVRLVRRRGVGGGDIGENGRRRVALVVLAVLAAGSFAYSLYLTRVSAPSAYFSTFTRAWEFAAGALVAFLPAVGSRRWRQAGTGLGLALIVIAAFAYSGDTAFPAPAAALPIAGAFLALWLGRGTALEWAGRVRPVAVLGETSYAVYLWHWPLLVLAPYAIGRDLTRIDKLALAAMTLVLAWVSTTQWENRIRFSPRLLGAARPRIVAAWTGAGMVAVFALAAVGVGQAVVGERADAEHTAQLLSDNPECFGAQAMVTPDCHNPDLDGVLVPDPNKAGKDDANRAECWTKAGDHSELKICSVGETESYSKRIFAVGDSHNNTLLGAFDAIGREYGWRFDVSGRSGCYWTDADLILATPIDSEACRDWRQRVAAHIQTNSSEMDAIFVTRGRDISNVETAPGATVIETLISGQAAAIAARPLPDVPVIVLADNPHFPLETLDCVRRHGLAAATECALPRATVLPEDGIAELPRLAGAGVQLIDLTDYYCEAMACRPVIGHVVVYRDDGHHISATYAATLAPYLGAELNRILSEAG
jgi:peptidoglycan/LPS O-acetylase OafA/YrhL